MPNNKIQTEWDRINILKKKLRETTNLKGRARAIVSFAKTGKWGTGLWAYRPTWKRAHGPMSLQAYVKTGSRAYGPTGIRAYGPNDIRIYGLTGLRAYGPTGLQAFGPTNSRAYEPTGPTDLRTCGITDPLVISNHFEENKDQFDLEHFKSNRNCLKDSIYSSKDFICRFYSVGKAAKTRHETFREP